MIVVPSDIKMYVACKLVSNIYIKHLEKRKRETSNVRTGPSWAFTPQTIGPVVTPILVRTF